MNIKHITSEYIETAPFSSIVVDADEGFAPYYHVEIATDQGNGHGNGATEAEAVEAAKANLVAKCAEDVLAAVAKYEHTQGIATF